MCDPFAPSFFVHRRSPTTVERRYADSRLRAGSRLGSLFLGIGSRVAPVEPNRRTGKHPVLNSVPWLLARASLDPHIISSGSHLPVDSTPGGPAGGNQDGQSLSLPGVERDLVPLHGGPPVAANASGEPI